MTSEELAKILEEIASDADDGILTPEAVVNEAEKDKKGPLGSQFEWDDKKAAHSHRLDVARALIRKVRVTERVEHRGTVTVRVMEVPRYVHAPAVPHGSQGYVALSGIRRGGADSLGVLGDEMSRVVGATNRALAISHQIGRQAITDRLAALLTEAEAIAKVVSGGE